MYKALLEALEITMLSSSHGRRPYRQVTFEKKLRLLPTRPRIPQDRRIEPQFLASNIGGLPVLFQPSPHHHSTIYPIPPTRPCQAQISRSQQPVPTPPTAFSACPLVSHEHQPVMNVEEQVCDDMSTSMSLPSFPRPWL
jgi:hypothetical protein